MKEADLCREFRARAEKHGWTVYPETSGWDLLLVATEDVSDRRIGVGDQVGVEAKLRGNVSVLRQAADGMRYPYRGPRFGGVLVPKAGKDFCRVAFFLKLNVWVLAYKHLRVAYPHEGRKPLWVPPVVPLHDAGVPSPSPLTPWRVKALELCNLLDTGAEVTRNDMKKMGLDPKIWMFKKWLVPTGKKRGRSELLRKPDDIGPDWPAIGFENEAQEIAALERTA